MTGRHALGYEGNTVTSSWRTDHVHPRLPSWSSRTRVESSAAPAPAAATDVWSCARRVVRLGHARSSTPNGSSGTVRCMARSRPAAATRASVPLQWPLVGRLEEIEFFERRSTIRAPTASSCTAAPVSARRGSPTNACRSRTGRAARSRGATAGEGTSRRRSARSRICCRPAWPTSAAISSRCSTPSRPSCAAGRARSARAVRRRPPPARRDLGDPARAARRRRPRVPRRRPCAPMSRSRRRSPACGNVPASPRRSPRARQGRRRHPAASRPARSGRRRARSTTLWSASRGNVLFVRELVLGALESGRLRRPARRLATDGSAGHDGAAAGAGGSAARRARPRRRASALDVLAVWEPTGLSMVESTSTRGCLERLDRSGLLAIRTDGRRRHMLRSRIRCTARCCARVMSALTRRRLLVEHADLIEHAVRAGGRIRSVSRRHVSTRPRPPIRRSSIEAARLARWGHDFAPGRTAGPRRAPQRRPRRSRRHAR